MSNLTVPDIHEHDRDIPAGKVLVAEYRDIPADAPRATPVTLDSGIDKFGRPVKLEAVSAGWAIAGSMLRWDNGRFRVSVEIDGTRHSRAFRDFDGALDLFRRWTLVL